MKLTLENFFSHLIFNPSDADTEKEQAIAWAATIAFGFFSLGACHAVCALRNYCFTHRPPKQATKQDQTISEVKDKALGAQPSKQSLEDLLIDAITAPTNVNTVSINKNFFTDSSIKAPSNIEVKIPPQVKITLDKLFEDSPYSIDNLPIYPIVVNDRDHTTPKRETMTDPVMKGIDVYGKPFIVIKMDCDLKDEDIEKVYITRRDGYRNNRHLTEVLVLVPSNISPLMLHQMGLGSMRPLFFTKSFTSYKDGSAVNDQKGNFEAVQTLLKTGKSPDSRGLVWSIPDFGSFT
jgi:hypothetical protein